jgi:dTDP-4-amino-4,6-dideoxygalactose transaminase
MQVYDNKDYYSACHLFVVRLDLNKIDKTHEQIFKEMRVLGIGVNLHYIPIHMHPYYKNMGFKEGDFPKAESYYKETLSLPIYPDLSRKEVEFVSISLINVIKNK